MEPDIAMGPEDVLSNQCADLVSWQRFEPAVLQLLRGRRAGEWVPVAELYRLVDTPAESIRPTICVTWLPSPTNQPGYVVIYFCDDELPWNMTAYYNAARLFDSIAPS
jgi:hypothetical protein